MKNKKTGFAKKPPLTKSEAEIKGIKNKQDYVDLLNSKSLELENEIKDLEETKLKLELDIKHEHKAKIDSLKAQEIEIKSKFDKIGEEQAKLDMEIEDFEGIKHESLAQVEEMHKICKYKEDILDKSIEKYDKKLKQLEVREKNLNKLEMDNNKLSKMIKEKEDVLAEYKKDILRDISDAKIKRGQAKEYLLELKKDKALVDSLRKDLENKVKQAEEKLKKADSINFDAKALEKEVNEKLKIQLKEKNENVVKKIELVKILDSINERKNDAELSERVARTEQMKLTRQINKLNKLKKEVLED